MGVFHTGWAVAVILLAHAASAGDFKTYDLDNANGGHPGAGVFVDKAGNIYGTAISGGQFGLGTIFEIPVGGTETQLYSFQEGDGEPGSNLVMDAAGNLFGTTSNGGTQNAGTIFELSPNPDGSWVYQVIYSFCALKDCADGLYPSGSITLVNDTIYGTTVFGSYSNVGLVFALRLPADQLQVVRRIGSISIGPPFLSPWLSGVRTYGKKLVGTSTNGGPLGGGCPKNPVPTGCGTVFEIRP